MLDENEKWGHYLIEERIAHGGMAEIYRAKTMDPNGINRLVVLKRILPHIASNPEYINMLIDEAKIAVHFNHGNIAQIYDLGKIDDDYFIAMEYVDGKTLGQIQREMKARSERVPFDILAYVMMELCRALDYIHNKTNNEGEPMGVVHRDISPQNIICSYSGNVKIIDFGVAKADDKMIHTESGVLKGKFAYMSPEQADGRDVDHRSDIFSCGILLWELLTQKRLFKRSSNKETIKAVLKGQYQSASKLRTDLPGAFEKIVDRALQKRPSKRYQQASEMAQDLNRFIMEYNPEFRPGRLAQFLYMYFGPEPDELGLPVELEEIEVPVKEAPRRLVEELEKIELIDEEKTEREPMPSRHKQRLMAGLIAGPVVLIILFLGLRLNFDTVMGQLYLEVDPINARVVLSEQIIEPSVDGIYYLNYLAQKPLSLQVSAEGFKSYSDNIVLKKDQDLELKIRLSENEKPFAELFIDTNPPGATVYLNDIEWGQKTPIKIPQLRGGLIYEIGVFLDGYTFHREKIEFEPGQTKTLQLNLTHDYAVLEIFSSPPGAYVTIDGQVVGKTPFRDSKVEPGEETDYQIELVGFKSLTQSVTLKSGEEKRLTLSLEKK